MRSHSLVLAQFACCCSTSVEAIAAVTPPEANLLPDKSTDARHGTITMERSILRTEIGNGNCQYSIEEVFRGSSFSTAPVTEEVLNLDAVQPGRLCVDLSVIHTKRACHGFAQALDPRSDSSAVHCRPITTGRSRTVTISYSFLDSRTGGVNAYGKILSVLKQAKWSLKSIWSRVSKSEATRVHEFANTLCRFLFNPVDLGIKKDPARQRVDMLERAARISEPQAVETRLAKRETQTLMIQKYLSGIFSGPSIARTEPRVMVAESGLPR